MSNIQEIFTAMKDQILSKIPLPFHKQKTLESICSCRTPEMGGFIEQCSDCGETVPHFHSCGNRHCPVCQGAQQAKWIEKQLNNTLPVQYFHVVFTLPSELNPLVFSNQKILYGILFKAASETILEMCANKKNLGAQPGFTSVLHTWGQNLQFHPHLHCIVMGGGLSSDKLHFVQSSKKFFLPVKAVSKKFKGKFLHYLKQEFQSESLHLPKSEADLAILQPRLNFLDKLHSSDWVVYAKKPFDSANHVIRYLGRYTHRVAISDSRIVDFDPVASKVSFEWKDYKDNNKKKVMTLDAIEFVRRYLLHVLPPGFMKIRHYGILGNRNRKDKLSLCRKLLRVVAPIIQPSNIEETAKNICKVCSGLLYVVMHTHRHNPILYPLRN
jgi:hypothetical protein